MLIHIILFHCNPWKCNKTSFTLSATWSGRRDPVPDVSQRYPPGPRTPGMCFPAWRVPESGVAVSHWSYGLCSRRNCDNCHSPGRLHPVQWHSGCEGVRKGTELRIIGKNFTLDNRLSFRNVKNKVVCDHFPTLSSFSSENGFQMSG